MNAVVKGTPAELAEYARLVHKASGRQYPRTCVSERGGPMVIVTGHATLDEKAGWYMITPQAKTWLAREQAAAAEEKLLTVKETTDLAAAVAKEEPMPVAEVAVVAAKATKTEIER